MKLNETVFAAINRDGTVEESQEGLFVSEDKQSLKEHLKAWRVPLKEVEIKKVKIVLADE